MPSGWHCSPSRSPARTQAPTTCASGRAAGPGSARRCTWSASSSSARRSFSSGRCTTCEAHDPLALLLWAGGAVATALVVRSRAIAATAVLYLHGWVGFEFGLALDERRQRLRRVPGRRGLLRRRALRPRDRGTGANPRALVREQRLSRVRTRHRPADRGGRPVRLHLLGGTEELGRRVKGSATVMLALFVLLAALAFAAARRAGALPPPERPLRGRHARRRAVVMLVASLAGGRRRRLRGGLQPPLRRRRARRHLCRLPERRAVARQPRRRPRRRRPRRPLLRRLLVGASAVARDDRRRAARARDRVGARAAAQTAARADGRA